MEKSVRANLNHTTYGERDAVFKLLVRDEIWDNKQKNKTN